MAGAVGLALERGIIRPLESLFATWGVSLVLQQVFRHSWLTRTSLSLDFCLDVGDSFYIMVRGAIVAKGPITDLNQDIV